MDRCSRVSAMRRRSGPRGYINLPEPERRDLHSMTPSGELRVEDSSTELLVLHVCDESLAVEARGGRSWPIRKLEEREIQEGHDETLPTGSALARDENRYEVGD